MCVCDATHDPDASGQLLSDTTYYVTRRGTFAFMLIRTYIIRYGFVDYTALACFSFSAQKAARNTAAVPVETLSSPAAAFGRETRTGAEAATAGELIACTLTTDYLHLPHLSTYL